MGLTDYLVRVPGEFDDVLPMHRIVLASRNGSVVRLSDVGTVEDGFAEISRYITINGEPDRSMTSDVLATPVRLPSGRLIRTANIAQTAVEYGPVEIERKDQGAK